MTLPDFIIIGAMKSGTSTLHSNLQMHPGIGMSELKEPHYFDKNFDKSISWYSQQFTGNKPINGESTPGYTWAHLYPDVPKRIHETIPDVKLIYLLRDPIDRIISHLHHDLYRDRFKLEDIDSIVLEDPQYIMTSNYYYQIQQYIKYFSLDKILFLETNSLKKDLNKSLNQIAAFLELEDFNFDKHVKVRNQSSRKYLIKNYDFVHENFPRRITKLYHWLFYFINIKITRPVLKKNTLEQIKTELLDDTEKLKKLSGKTFNSWKTYNNI